MSRVCQLSDEQWEEIRTYIPNRQLAGKDTRLFLDAVFWILRTGSPWRDLPACYGLWNTVYQRFRRWARSGIFQNIFESLSVGGDCTLLSIDGTIIKIHQDGTGAQKNVHLRK
jgi:transposase